MPTIGGAVIEMMSFTRSLGCAPASATFTCPGSVAIGTDDTVVVGLGGTTFFGLVKSVLADTCNGLKTQVTAVDNREWLHRESVYGTFNNTEILEDDVTTPGIDRKKRFWHILPKNWAVQLKTYTDVAYAAAEILTLLRNANTVTFGWTFNTHPAQAEPVLGIDANNGAKLATVLQTISEKQGLLFTVVGANQLVWYRKGEGTTPEPTNTCFDRRTGEALANNDTQVRIVGERNLVQCDSIPLEPDWNPYWNDYWFEPEWIAQVAAKFGPFPADLAGEAALFAKAKSVTLREWCKKVGGAAADRGKWGEVSRMEMPVWLYLNDVVFKAYRVPRTFAIGKSSWESLELSEGLLAEVDYSPSSGAITYATGDLAEFYPDTRGFLLAQGQPTDLLNSKYQKALSPDDMATARDLWTAVGDFTLDVKNKAVIFKSAVILPGVDPNGLFVFPNKGILKAKDPAYRVALPNAAVQIQPAPVRASLVFAVERYSSEHGSGHRKGAHYVNGLARHSLYRGGTFSQEVTFADGKKADEKADKVALGLTLRQVAYRHGGFKRRGTVGMALNGSTDRITITLGWRQGIEEEVEFSKERTQVDFLNERDLDRRQRTKELFPGREANRDEVFQLRTIAKLGPLTRDRGASGSLNDVMGLVLGDPQASVVVEKVPSGTKGGQPLGRSRATGDLSTSGELFGGVMVVAGAKERGPVAHRGLVPVRVMGPVSVGDPVGLASGKDYAVRNGVPHIGVTKAEITSGITEAVTIPVLLNAPKPVGHPFKVSLSSLERDNDGTVKKVNVIVEKNSFVMKSERWTSTIGVSGLDKEFELKADEKVWLQCDLGGDLQITSCTLKHSKTGEVDKWEHYPEPVEYTTTDVDDPTRKQKRWHQLLGCAVSSTGSGREGIDLPFAAGKQKLIQSTMTHLIQCEKCYSPSGMLIRALAPWQAPGVTTSV